jgi:hypothetical protein
LTQVLDLGLSERKVLHLLLEISHLASLDLDFLDRDSLFLPPRRHSFLLTGAQEAQRLAFGLVSRRSAHTVDVRVDVVGTVELDHPVDRGEVETSGCNVGTDQQGGFRGGKPGKDIESCGLLLLAVEVHQG